MTQAKSDIFEVSSDLPSCSPFHEHFILFFSIQFCTKDSITEQCACVSDGLVEEKGRQLSSFTFYLFPYSTFFKNFLINSLVYFLLLYCYAFFLTRKGKYYQEMKKPLHLSVKTFFFSLPKIISYDESSAGKNKNANLSGHVIPALKSDPTNHCCRIIRKASYQVCNTCKSCDCCAACDSQRLKPNPVNSLLPRDECQVRWAISCRDM